MRLSAEMLDTWDRCERRFAFERDFVAKSISPTSLLYHALEAGIVAADPEQAAKDATMDLASQSELQLTELNAFTAIRHVGYLAGIIALGVRMRLGALERLPATPEWSSALFAAADGRNHRIELVSHWDDDRLRAATHSWRVIGELAALQAPLTLTSIVIGAHKGGRRHSAWTKGFLHPQNHKLRFARRPGGKASGFSEGWEEVWREQRGEISTAAWLAAMKDDGILTGMIQSRLIDYCPADQRMIAARGEMETIRGMMMSASTAVPMRRSSCDEMGRGACPFQSVCYSPMETDPSQLPHLYTLKNN